MKQPKIYEVVTWEQWLINERADAYKRAVSDKSVSPNPWLDYLNEEAALALLQETTQ